MQLVQTIAAAARWLKGTNTNSDNTILLTALGIVSNTQKVIQGTANDSEKTTFRNYIGAATNDTQFIEAAFGPSSNVAVKLENLENNVPYEVTLVTLLREGGNFDDPKIAQEIRKVTVVVTTDENNSNYVVQEIVTLNQDINYQVTIDAEAPGPNELNWSLSKTGFASMSNFYTVAIYYRKA